MVECITEVNEVIKLPTTTVRLLLHHFRWDKEKLMERFYDPNHQDELFRQAHIVNPFKKPAQLQTQVSSSSHRSTRRQNSATSPSSASSLTTNPMRTLPEQTCLICCSTRSTGDMAGLECGHVFCISCWRYYLTTKIMHEGIGQTISCPAKCDILVDDKTVLSLIGALDVRRKYQHLITNSFVECNRNMRWCPGKNCTNAIKASYCDVAMVRRETNSLSSSTILNALQVTCTSCKTSFCFQCGQSWHEPIKCKWLKRWQKKCHDDSETSNWIAANTKECPKCHATIGRRRQDKTTPVISFSFQKRTAVAITSSVRISLASMISAGCVWVRGNRTVLHGTTAIVSMRTTRRRLAMNKTVLAKLFNVIFIITSVITIITNR